MQKQVIALLWGAAGLPGQSQGPSGSRPGSARTYPLADTPQPSPRRFHGRHELAPAMPRAHGGQRAGPQVCPHVSESESGGMFLCERLSVTGLQETTVSAWAFSFQADHRPSVPLLCWGRG